MLSLNTIPQVEYSDPWISALSDRLRVLAGGNKRIAYFYEKADNSTFRYRIYNMVQVLNDADSHFSASYFFLEDLHRLGEIAAIADILVICRARYDSRINNLVTAFRKQNKQIFFDVDDLVFDTKYAHLIFSTLDQPLHNAQIWDFWYAYIGRIGATLKLCDKAITTNEYLAKRIAEFAGIQVSIIPNFLNREQLEISDQIYLAKKSLQTSSDGFIHLGYFSGSPSHNKDFKLVASALECLLEENDRLGVVVAGYIEAGSALQRFGPRTQYFPFCDFINLQRLIGMVEFNLMPLQSNTFTNCKSELKYFEAAIVGTLSIASPTYTYAKAIDHGENSYISQAHMWGKTIKTAINNMGRYQQMAEKAYQDARTKYAWFNQQHCILAALGLN